MDKKKKKVFEPYEQLEFSSLDFDILAIKTDKERIEIAIKKLKKLKKRAVRLDEK